MPDIQHHARRPGARRPAPWPRRYGEPGEVRIRGWPGTGVDSVPAGVEVFEVQGALFFGAATKFRESIQQVEAPARVLIVRLRNVIAVDASGLRELELLCEDCARHGTTVVLSGTATLTLNSTAGSGTFGGNTFAGVTGGTSSVTVAGNAVTLSGTGTLTLTTTAGTGRPPPNP